MIRRLVFRTFIAFLSKPVVWRLTGFSAKAVRVRHMGKRYLFLWEVWYTSIHNVLLPWYGMLHIHWKEFLEEKHGEMKLIGKSMIWLSMLFDAPSVINAFSQVITHLESVSIGYSGSSLSVRWWITHSARRALSCNASDEILHGLCLLTGFAIVAVLCLRLSSETSICGLCETSWVNRFPGANLSRYILERNQVKYNR